MKHLLCSVALGAIALAVNPALAATNSSCAGEFAAVDTDNNGRISKTEADAAASKNFSRLDTDSSGGVSMAEWEKCGISSQSAGGTPPLSSDQDFTQADADRSGAVSREEAATAAEKGHTAAASDATPEDFARLYGDRFRMLDADGDGEISKTEWTNRDNAKVDTAFRHIDDDNNGEISKLEYAGNIGSVSESEPVTVWHFFIY